MLVRTVVAPLLGTNCHLVADAEGTCVVVDPGAGVVDDVLAVVRRERLHAVAILLTHGHLDHTWSAAALCETLGVPVHVHEADAYRLDDPVGSLGPLGAQLADLAGHGGPPVPSRVEPFSIGPDGVPDPALAWFGGEPVLTVLHAPGHTQGSTVYLLEPADGAPVALTGDVLFAGTIGRTDLPGGDDAAMGATLRRLARLDPCTLVVPGHGASSSVETELATNPYLRAAR